MLVEETRPRSMIPQPPAEQCQHEVFNYPNRWRDKRMLERGWDLKKCTNGVSVRIDGVGYCRQHGGKIALEKLITEGRADG